LIVEDFNMVMPPEKTTKMLNELLRGEISAVETYRQALQKVGDVPGSQQLNMVHQDHTRAVTQLREHVRRYGGEPAEGSGGWGAFAKAVQGTANIFGDESSLKALKEGEEHGVKEYQEALEEDGLPAECKTLIQQELLPKQQMHISILDNLMEVVKPDRKRN
jgi:uncharacterized protein (TIGR02284 family)